MRVMNESNDSKCHFTVFLYNGKLPWQGMGERKSPFIRIRKCKERTPLTELCKDFPQGLQDIIKDCRQNRIQPPYTAQRKVFRDGLTKMEEVLDWQFDWESSQNSNRQQGGAATSTSSQHLQLTE
mmetsp:Transcript_12533/g.20089  ORF Transcript_12533/g.20089 Transcript_12533/m.20089 type:complete len:125 (+) Transcript_12533:1079-1453(+)